MARRSKRQHRRALLVCAALAAQAAVLSTPARAEPGAPQLRGGAPTLQAPTAVSAIPASEADRLAETLLAAYTAFDQEVRARFALAQTTLAPAALRRRLEAACRDDVVVQASTRPSQVSCAAALDGLVAGFSRHVDGGAEPSDASFYGAALAKIDRARRATPSILSSLDPGGAAAWLTAELVYLRDARGRWLNGEATWRENLAPAAIATYARAVSAQRRAAPAEMAGAADLIAQWTRYIALPPRAGAARRTQIATTIEGAVQADWQARAANGQCARSIFNVARGLHRGPKSAASQLFALMDFQTAADPRAPRRFDEPLEAALAGSRTALARLTCDEDLNGKTQTRGASPSDGGGRSEVALLAKLLGVDWGGARPGALGLEEGATPIRLISEAARAGGTARGCQVDDCAKSNCAGPKAALQALTDAAARLGAADAAIQAARSEQAALLEGAYGEAGLSIAGLAAALAVFAEEAHYQAIGLTLMDLAAFAAEYRATLWDQRVFPDAPDQAMQRLRDKLQPAAEYLETASAYQAPLGGVRGEVGGGLSALSPDLRALDPRRAPITGDGVGALAEDVRTLQAALARAAGLNGAEAKRQALQDRVETIDSLQGSLNAFIPNWRPAAERRRAAALTEPSATLERRPLEAAFRRSPLYAEYRNLLAQQLLLRDAAMATGRALEDVEGCMLGRCPLQVRRPSPERDVALIAAALPETPVWAAALAQLDADLALDAHRLNGLNEKGALLCTR